jgi:hypothetical protein
MDTRFRWAIVLAALVGAVAIGVVSYNAGMSHGLAMSAVTAGGTAAAGTAAGAPFYPPYGPYGWYRPWGFGFGIFGPFLFILFWFFVIRLLFWGGFHRRRWYYSGPYDGPRAFDEWHRRAHERMNSQTTAPTEGRA